MKVAGIGGNFFDPFWEEGMSVCMERSHGACKPYLVGNDIGGAPA